MRALVLAVLLALATVVPAFADDDSSDFRPATPTAQIGGPAIGAP